MELKNSLGQPIGAPVPTWTERRRPPKTAVRGQYVALEPLDPKLRGQELFDAAAEDKDGRMWTYMFHGPFATREAYVGWMLLNAMGDDPQYYSVIDLADGKAVGIASFMRIDSKGGALEVGGIALAPRGQRGRVSTEAMFLMMKRAFDELAYRRYEWKCDFLNAPSRAAAVRLGFSYEGIFRQATIYKGRNRDTAWYAIIDTEWPFLKAAYEAWLKPDNFDPEGRQKTRLSTLTADALKAARAPAA